MVLVVFYSALKGFEMRIWKVWICLPNLALFLMFTTMPVAAQEGTDAGALDSMDTLGDVSAGPSESWRYMVGLGAAAIPDYEGSGDYEAAPLPVARAQKGHQYGQLFGLKLTSNLIPHPNFRAGPVVNYRGERDDVDNSQVDALSDVDAALELGAQVGYDHYLESGVIGIEVEWVHDVADGHEGWLLTPAIHYRRPLGDRWGFSLGVSTTYASDDYMDAYFSISPGDSAASGLPVSSADGGFKDVDVNLAFTYDITESWDLGIIGSWTRLLNDAEDSPVTKVGDENQFTAGFFVSYSWGQ